MREEATALGDDFNATVITIRSSAHDLTDSTASSPAPSKLLGNVLSQLETTVAPKPSPNTKNCVVV